MKNKSIVSQLVVAALMALSLWGCNGSSNPASTDTRQLDRTIVDGQTCTPAVASPGTRITCPANMVRTDGCNLMFDTQLIPRSTIAYNADRTVTFAVPPAATGLYNITKICGAEQVVVAHEQVNGRVPSGSGGSSGNSEFAECAAGGNQCQVGSVCRANRCVPSCNSTYDCPGGQICRDQQCVANTDPECDNPIHPERACTGNKSGLVCVHGSCEPCRDNLACGNKGPAFSGFVCSASNINSSLGLCQPCQNTSQCGAGQACVMDTSLTSGGGRCGACTTNSQCGEGNICNIRTGQCSNNGVASNASVGVVVSEVPDAFGLLRIDWNVRGIQTAAIREAYVYGPFGGVDTDGCNNILRTVENSVPRDPQPRNGSPCDGRVVENGQNVCRLISSSAMTTMSAELPSRSPATPTTTLPVPGDMTAPEAVIPTLPSATTPTALTCRVPINTIGLTGTIYTKMKVSPSAFRGVVKTVDNQLFTGEGRFTAGGTDLRIDRVEVSPTSPSFAIRGSYTRTESTPTFEGCDGGVDESVGGAVDLTADRIQFVRRCPFPTDGTMPRVVVNLEESSLSDRRTEKVVTFDECTYDETVTRFDFGNLYDRSSPTRSVCDRATFESETAQILHTGTACTTIDALLDLQTRIRRTCRIFVEHEALTTDPVKVPWGVSFEVLQTPSRGCSETGGYITTGLHPTSGLSVASGDIVYNQKLTRNLTCNAYQLRIEDGPQYNLDLRFNIANPGIHVYENYSSRRWSYDFTLADTDGDNVCLVLGLTGCVDTDTSGWCQTNGQPNCTEGAEGAPVRNPDHPVTCHQATVGSDAISCNTRGVHDSADAATGCTNYKMSFAANIESRDVTQIDIDCCIYGEGWRGWPSTTHAENEAYEYGVIAPGRCTQGPQGRLYHRSVTVNVLSPTGGSVNTTFNKTFYGESVRCVMSNPDRTYSAFLNLNRPAIGRCDSADIENRDLSDAAPGRVPDGDVGYPVGLPTPR